MATAGSIVVDLLLRTGSFETDTGRAEKRLKQLEKQINDTAKTIGTAIGAGVATAVTALGVLTVQSIQYADEIDELSARLSISTEKLSEWGYVAKLSGTSLDALSSAIPKLSKNLAAALDENSRFADLFGALGISVTDASGKLRDVEDVLPEIADKFKALDDDTTEAALAMELFGKSGAALLEFLNRGSSGIEDLSARARELGIVVGEETAANAALFNDKLDDMQALSTALGIQIADRLLPTLIDLVDRFADLVKEGGAAEKIVSAIEFVVDDVSLSFDQLNHLLETAGNLFGGMKDQAAGALQVLAGFASFDWDQIQKGLAGFTGGSARVGMGFESFEDFQARKNRPQSNAAAGPDLGWLGVPDFSGQQQPFSAVGFSAVAPVTGGGVDEERVRGFFRNADGASKAAKATKELSEAEKAYKDIMEVNLLIDEQVDEFRRGRIDDEYALAKARELATQQVNDQISDLEFELSILGKSNLERAKEIELRYAGAAATDEQRAKIEELVGALDKEATVTAQRAEVMDGMREAGRGFLEDLKEGEGVWDSLTNAVGRFADRLYDLAAQGIIDQLFGKQGDTGGGAWGDAIGSFFGSVFGGAKAGGGDTIAGRAYLVGEQGPEMFVPRTAGLVVPADRTSQALGGNGGNYSPTFNFLLPKRVDNRSQMQIAQTADQSGRRATRRNRG